MLSSGRGRPRWVAGGAVLVVGAAGLLAGRHITGDPSRRPPAVQSEARLEEERGRQVLSDLLGKLRSSPFHGKGNPELAVLTTSESMRAWIELVDQVAPELKRELSRQITDRLCDPALGAEEAILYGRLGLALPELTTRRGFECFFSSHQTEDPALWALLDSWRFSQHGNLPAIAALAARAQDERTRRRFMTR